MARYVPKGTNQKLKLYYLAKIMVNNTGDEHAMTLQDIKNALEQYEITADRKSLYDDFNVLRDMGIDILREQRGRSYYYHVGNFDADNKVILAGMSVMGISAFCFANQPPDLSRLGVGECKSN